MLLSLYLLKRKCSFLLSSIFRATLSCKRTTLFCRLPLFPFASRPEAMHLGDLLRLSVRMSRKIKHQLVCYDTIIHFDAPQRAHKIDTKQRHYSAGQHALAPNDLFSEDKPKTESFKKKRQLFSNEQQYSRAYLLSPVLYLCNSVTTINKDTFPKTVSEY